MTTEDLFKQYSNLEHFEEGPPEYLVDKEDFKKSLVEFAKFHVEAALKAASKLDFESVDHPEANDYEEAVRLTIQESYPLSNIK